MSIESTIDQYLKKHELSNQKIAIACSAGLDSMVLLTAIIKLQAKSLIHCVHLDHGLREDSLLAKEFLEDFCKEQSLAFSAKSFAPGELRADENSAREARYAFFLEACKEAKINHIFLAHNLNDQAETIIFRAFRGTNTRGLQAMQSRRSLSEELDLHRPILNLTRALIEDYAQKNGVRYVEDTTNQDFSYSRNKIRHQIFKVAEQINPEYLNNLVKLSQLVAEEQSYLEEVLDLKLNELGVMPWGLEDFRTIPKTIQRKILERSFTANIKFCDDFMKAIAEGGFHRINYKKSRFFTIKQKKIYIEYN